MTGFSFKKLVTSRPFSFVVGGALTAMAAGSMLTGCRLFEGSTSQAVNYSVMLEPAEPGILKVAKANMCNKGEHEGCLRFKKNAIGNIKFYLPESENTINNCNNAKQVITRFEVTAVAETSDKKANGDAQKGAPASSLASKGEFNPPHLPAWLKHNAFRSLDLKTGIVYEAKPQDASTQLWLINLNSQEERLGELQFWYRVTVTDCAPPYNTWVTDPRGDNEGTKR